MLSLTAMVLLLGVSQQAGTFNAPGYGAPVSGVWYAGGNASSAMPLGGLGTGFVDFTAGAAFGESTAQNNWLKPQQVPQGCGLTVQVGDKHVELFPKTKTPETLRFWGHYPAADVDFGSSFGDDLVYLRVFTPLIPHDYALSGVPAALFRFTVVNQTPNAKAVEIGLQWQAPGAAPGKSKGNVEAALGWRCAELAPGKSWKPSPILVFARNRTELAERLQKVSIPAESITGTLAPEGKSYTSGEVQDFLLDDLGGFSWEQGQRQSAVFDGAPNIGQIFWNLSYDDKRAGRGMNGGYGLRGSALPARTEDGKLEVRVRVAEAGPNCLALVYTILNMSAEPLRDLRFGIAVNADVGGPGQAEDQRGEFDSQLKAAVIENTHNNNVLALAGSPDDCIVGTWPDTHNAMLNNAWTALGDPAQPPPPPKAAGRNNELILPNGSYAVGATGDAKWAIKYDPQEEELVRVRAVRTLGPHETAEVTLGLAWFFPNWTSSDGESLRHHYAVDFKDAAAVLDAMLPRAAEIEKKIVQWQETIYATPAIPSLLKDAVINGLYIWPRNSWWMDDGRFFQSESFTGCPITETFVCRFNGSFPLALLFPECERATMRSVAAAQAPTGEIPFGFGSPMGSRSPYYHVQHPIVSPEFVLTTWRNYVLWKDKKYLDEMYPRCQNALRFAMTLDKDNDGVVNEDPGSEKGFPANQYYDIWPWWGTSAYTGGIWLAALRAGEEMAKSESDAAFAEELRTWYRTASESYFKKLWTGSYYRLYNDPAHGRLSETCLTNALCGQWFAYATGLGEIHPSATILNHIDTVFRRNVPITKVGAVNGVRTDGTPDETFPDHSAVVTIGEVWNFCALAAFAGRREDALDLFVHSYANILLDQRTPWNIPWSLDPTTGTIKWGVNYYSNPCVWTLFQALDPGTYATLASP